MMAAMGTREVPLRLPPGCRLDALWARQRAARGAIYRATFPGDLETLFGPAPGLRDREFLLEVDGERWLAAPTPGITVTSDGEGTMVFDNGSIHARTDGVQTTIDFQLRKRADD